MGEGGENSSERNRMAEILRMCWYCSTDRDECDQRRRHREINRSLRRERRNQRQLIKVLLLGAGESGKSTFLKQMRIIHGAGFKESDLMGYRDIIYQNIVKGMKVLIDAKHRMSGFVWDKPENASHANMVLSYHGEILDNVVYLKYLPSMRVLWSDSGIQLAFQRRREYQLSDSVQFFLDNLEKTNRLDYVPDQNDVLHARKATKEIVESNIKIDGIPFRFIDVGGQRSQRGKWFQFFDEVTSILFLASSSEFDQVILEDRRTNRLFESLNIFELIINNKTYAKISIILFLNKTDLLAEKIKSSNIKHYYPNFKGDPENLTHVQSFLVSLFHQRNKDSSRMFFPHFTTAVDTNNIRHIFNDVKDIILHKNIGTMFMQ